MKKNIFVCLLALLLVPGSSFAKHGKGHGKEKSGKSQAKASKEGFSEDHPVFGSGRLHPVHDDKVIGKFKNADKIKQQVEDIDGMDEDDLDEELSTIDEELEAKKTELAKLRKERLEKIRTRKQELLKTKADLEKATDNPMTGMMNKFGLMINDMQMNQTTKEESQVNEEINSGSERVEELNLLHSYIESIQG